METQTSETSKEMPTKQKLVRTNTTPAILPSGETSGENQIHKGSDSNRFRSISNPISIDQPLKSNLSSSVPLDVIFPDEEGLDIIEEGDEKVRL